ncbi:MAG: hypothetical protein AAFN10_17275 [Bacteroidota bacterium]
MKIEIPQIDPTLWRRLEIEALHRGVKVSDLVLTALQQFLGVKTEKPNSTAGLAQLAGKWTEAESQTFEQHTSYFNQIDPELWQ